MDNSGSAYQRRNHVLSGSSSRFRNLVKSGSAGEDDDMEMNSRLDPNKARKSPLGLLQQGKARHGAADGDEGVEEGNPANVRFMGYVQLHLYFFALLVGAFVCYLRHHQNLEGHYPRILLNLFSFLKGRRAHHLAERGFTFWDKVPLEKRKKVVKYMSYGTVALNLYPVFTSPMKPKKQDGTAPPPADNENTPNQKFIKLATSLVRVVSATLFCGLLGYDLAYNLDLVKGLFRRN